MGTSLFLKQRFGLGYHLYASRALSHQAPGCAFSRALPAVVARCVAARTDALLLLSVLLKRISPPRPRCSADGDDAAGASSAPAATTTGREWDRLEALVLSHVANAEVVPRRQLDVVRCATSEDLLSHIPTRWVFF